MDRPDCKYGVDCYQKNPEHKKKYKHPSEDQANENGNKEPVKRPSDADQSDEEIAKKAKICGSPSKELTTANEEYHQHPKPAVPEIDINFSRQMMGHYGDPNDPKIAYSQKQEYNELVGNPKMFIKCKFLVDMPDDFYSLWEFCKTKCPDKPETAFEKFGLQLVGPFDVLAKKFDKAEIREPGEYLRHWRFYYDVPEFQTVLVKEKTGFHYGYWRDDTADAECFVARNDAEKGCEINIIGCNIFQAVLEYFGSKVSVTPFNSGHVNAMKKSVEEWAKAHNFSLTDKERIKKRDALVVCKTFHKAGLVVPYDRKTDVGYRPLLESDANLKKILARFDKLETPVNEEEFASVMEHLQPLVTAAYISIDENDFGNALELAIDLFCSGNSVLHRVMLPVFIAGYTMVQRPQFIAILKTHLESRKKDLNLDILAVKE